MEQKHVGVNDVVEMRTWAEKPKPPMGYGLSIYLGSRLGPLLINRTSDGRCDEMRLTWADWQLLASFFRQSESIYKDD